MHVFIFDQMDFHFVTREASVRQYLHGLDPDWVSLFIKFKPIDLMGDPR
jgi:hypothetical protein